MRREHAEFVPFGIGEYHPGSVRGPADVDPSRAERDEPADLNVSVVGIQVDV